MRSTPSTSPDNSTNTGSYMAPSQFRQTAETTHSPLLIDYHDQTSSYCRDRPTAVTHQRPRSPAVNDAKGAKHADDAADAAKGTDGAVPPSKGGGDGGGTPPGKGDKDGGGGGDDPAKKSQEAFDRAKEAKEGLPDKRKFDNKTASSDHVKALSGWGADRPPGFQEPNVEDVLAKQKKIGHDVKKSGANDHGVDGRYYASHAERQLSLTAKEPQIGVPKAMCPDRQGYFAKLAQHEGRDWRLTDPDGTWIFRADGTVVSPATS